MDVRFDDASSSWCNSSPVTAWSAMRSSPPSALMVHTTVMLKNVPECFTRARLLYLLCKEGFSGAFNFLYVPLCFKEKTCLCYAFVNFVDERSLERFWQRFHGFRDWGVPSGHIGEVCPCERHQGLDDIIHYYRNNSVMHPSVPDECKPILLVGARRVPFPSPAKKIKMPKKMRSEERSAESIIATERPRGDPEGPGLLGGFGAPLVLTFTL